MNNQEMVNIFENLGGENYDKSNSAFKNINNNLHLLNSIILKKLPEDAQILCVGVGTGADLLELAKENPKWNFVGIEPAKSMIDECEKKLNKYKLSNQCELFNGYLSDYNSTKKFDAVLCLFVMHFIKDITQRAQMYKEMSNLLKKDAYLIITEISADKDDNSYINLLENWNEFHKLSGTPSQDIEQVRNMVENQLAVISSKETEKLIEQNGFLNANPFFQSFLIKGWYAQNK